MTGIEESHIIPVGGLAYYISPSRDFKGIICDPFKTIFFYIEILLLWVLFKDLD